MSEAKHLIFDWSGTLLDSLPSFYETCMKMFERLGHERIPLEKLRDEINIPYMVFWNSYFPNLTKEEEERMYVEEISMAKQSGLFKEVRGSLQRLHSSGHLLSVVSSDPTERITSEAKNNGVLEYFQEIIGWSYEKTPSIRNLSVRGKIEAFYVGDTTGDVEAAKRAGVKTIAISWGFHPKEKLLACKPDYVIDKISDLESLFS